MMFWRCRRRSEQGAQTPRQSEGESPCCPSSPSVPNPSDVFVGALSSSEREGECSGTRCSGDGAMDHLGDHNGLDPVCRICFDEGPHKGALSRVDSEQDRELISPCGCKGSQQWVHKICLKNWQRSVMMNCGNHPDQSAAERRHEICNVCKEIFTFAPITRRDLMASLANLPASMIAAGLMLVHEPERNLRDLTSLPHFIQVMVSIKHAHFKESVYVLTNTERHGASDGEDKIVGVNLVRTQEFESALFDNFVRAPGSYAELQRRKEKGMTLEFFHGGPCRPRQLRAIALLREAVSLHEDDQLREIYKDGTVQLVWGDIPSIIALTSSITSLCVYSGQAEWSRTQLLGEIARGMWGTRRLCDMAVDAVERLIIPGAVWSDLFGDAEWAPMNKMQEERRAM